MTETENGACQDCSAPAPADSDYCIRCQVKRDSSVDE